MSPGLLRRVGGEFSIPRDRLDELRRGGPAVARSTTALTSVMVALWGNAVVVIGRITGDPEWITLIAHPLAGIICLGVLRQRGWSRPLRGSGLPRLRSQVVAAGFVMVAAGWSVAWLVGGVVSGRNISPLRTVRLILATAWAEEAIHRGALVAIWVASGVGLRTLFVANMVTFGGWHLAGAVSCGQFHPLEVLGPAAGAAVLLWARLRTGSFLSAAAGHLAVNITGLSAITAVPG